MGGSQGGPLLQEEGEMVPVPVYAVHAGTVVEMSCTQGRSIPVPTHPVRAGSSDRRVGTGAPTHHLLLPPHS